MALSLPSRAFYGFITAIEGLLWLYHCHRGPFMALSLPLRAFYGFITGMGALYGFITRMCRGHSWIFHCYKAPHIFFDSKISVSTHTSDYFQYNFIYRYLSLVSR